MLESRALWLLPLLGTFACSAKTEPGAPRPDINSSESANTETPSTTTGRSSGFDAPSSPSAPLPSTEEPIGVPEPNRNDAGGEEACASNTATAELQSLELAFAFDVSGSMGKGDEPYHDKTLKWDPVVEASLAFFESNDIARVSASLVFFPTDGDEDERCEAASYDRADVDLQALPSDAFRGAIEAVTPEDEDDWRGGTPTLAVLEATLTRVTHPEAGAPTAKRAVVLVTDGTPQSCSEEADSIENVADAVARLRDATPVYVIGVANPSTEEEPDPPDNVSSLELIAQAGGTEKPYLIDTGDPQATIRAFADAIAAIRSQGLSCEVEIPPPPTGLTLDINKVNVTLTLDGEAVALAYSADCADSDAWHFDNEDSPDRIVLCGASCDRSKTSPNSSLDVEFGCERRLSEAR